MLRSLTGLPSYTRTTQSANMGRRPLGAAPGGGNLLPGKTAERRFPEVLTDILVVVDLLVALGARSARASPQRTRWRALGHVWSLHGLGCSRIDGCRAQPRPDNRGVRACLRASSRSPCHFGGAEAGRTRPPRRSRRHRVSLQQRVASGCWPDEPGHRQSSSVFAKRSDGHRRSAVLANELQPVNAGRCQQRD